MSSTLEMIALLDGAPLSVTLVKISGDDPPGAPTACNVNGYMYSASFDLEGRYRCVFTDVDGDERRVGAVDLVDGQTSEVVEYLWQLDTVRSSEVDSPKTGDNLVAVFVRNQAAQLLPNVRLQILTAGGDTIAGLVNNTNAQGRADFYLDQGSYRVLVTRAAGYETNDVESFTVSGPDTSVQVTINAITVGEPSTPDTCVCTLAVIDQNGLPVEGAVLTSTVESPAFVNDALVHFRHEPATSVDGVVQTELVRGLRYAIKIQHAGKSITFQIQVPDQDSFIMKPVTI